MQLEISEDRAKQFDKLEGTSIDIIQAYLDGDRPGGDDIVTARIMLGVVKSNRGTVTARHALRYSMVADLADPQATKKYIAATEPAIKKIIGQKGAARTPATKGSPRARRARRKDVT